VAQSKPKSEARPVRWGARILAHLRRWKRIDGGTATSSTSEETDSPSGQLVGAFRVAAGLPEYVVPHILRHSRATHMLKQGVPIWEAANALGMSVACWRQHYGHHAPDWQKDAANVSGNCHWASVWEQNDNRRSTFMVEFRGERMSLRRVYKLAKPRASYSTVYAPGRQNGLGLGPGTCAGIAAQRKSA
jgi:hypothetical protein